MEVAELQRQISRLSLEDLIQIAIHLLFEIEYRLELQRTRDQDISDSDISDSDHDLWFDTQDSISLQTSCTNNATQQEFEPTITW